MDQMKRKYDQIESEDDSITGEYLKDQPLDQSKRMKCDDQNSEYESDDDQQQHVNQPKKSALLKEVQSTINNSVDISIDLSKHTSFADVSSETFQNENMQQSNQRFDVMKVLPSKSCDSSSTYQLDENMAQPFNQLLSKQFNEKSSNILSQSSSQSSNIILSQSSNPLNSQQQAQEVGECSFINKLTLFKNTILKEIKKQSVDQNLKSHLQPFSKSNLFTKTDLKHINTIRSNFNLLIEQIKEESSHLLNDNDILVLDKLVELSASAQLLYYSLFFKKAKWFSDDNISQLKSKELKPSKVLTELVQAGFLLDYTSMDLEQALNIIDGKEINKYARGYVALESKHKIIKNLLEHCRVNASSHVKILNALKNDLKNKYFKLSPNHIVLWKILLIKFEPVKFDKKVHSHYSNMLAKSEADKSKYFPDYEISASSDLYGNSEDLDYFVKSCIIQLDINEKHYDDLAESLEEILVKFQEYIRFKDNQIPKLSTFLLRFTAGERLIECISQIVDELINNEMDEQATFCLRWLIKQNEYGANSIGEWYMKIVDILIDNKKTDKALKYCSEAINHQFISNSCKLYLIQKKSELDGTDDLNGQFKEIKSINADITEQIDTARRTNSKKFVLKQAVDDAVFNYYKKKLKTYEVAKNQSEFFRMILFHLFDDVIYAKKDNVFRYDLQHYPLDLMDKSFYQNRKTEFDAKFNSLKKKSMQEIFGIIKENRKLNNMKYGTSFSASADQIKNILECFTKEQLLKILHHLASNYADYKDMNTDLIMYETFGENKKLKFVNVQVNNAKFSEKKKHWMRYLNEIGFDVEVCSIDLTV